MKKLADIVGRGAREALKNRGFGDTRILTEWDKIVGSELACHSMPMRIKYPIHENDPVILQVKVSSGWNLQFSYLEPVILEKIASFFGSRLITKLHILTAPVKQQYAHDKKHETNNEQQSHSEENPFANSLDGIKDLELVGSLTRLGNNIALKGGKND